MKSIQKLGVGLVLLALLSGTSAFAVWSTNIWGTNSVGSYSGDYTNAVHWTPGVPATNDQAWFTNQQASAYTVTLQQSETSGVLVVDTDKVNFDLNGNLWTLKPASDAPGTWVAGYNADSSQSIGGASGEVATVTFSSSGAGTNTVLIAPSTFGFATWIGNTYGSATLNINTNLGYGVRVWSPSDPHYFGFNNATVNVDGPGAELRVDSYGGSANSTWNITGGGKVIARRGQFGHDGYWGGGMNTVNVSQAGILQTAGGSANIGYFSPGNRWNITDGGTWYGTDINMAHLTVYANHALIPYDTELLIDGAASSATLLSLQIGSYNAGSYPANARATLQNLATLSVTNYLTIEGGSAGSSYTNTLVVNNATINLGGGATAGVLTNQGIMRAMGTITGLGASPALVYSGSGGSGTGAFFEVGGSIGTLTLNNANLELAAGSETLWEFSDTGLDQIIVIGGSAILDGSNVFSLAAGSAVPIPGMKWGLGAYNFVVATGVTIGVNFYGNLTNLLGSYGLVENLDYRFGMMGIGGDQYALRLEFVPEPSTVILLLGGGLVLLRFWRRRR